MENQSILDQPKPAAAPAAPAAPAAAKAKNANTPLIVGICIGGVVLIGLIVWLIIVLASGSGSIIGEWKLVDYKKDGKSAVQENNATQEQIDSLASIFTINFKEGGKCEATYMSKSMTDCTYDDKKIVINGLEREYTKSGDTITFFYNDQELVVKKK